MEVIIPTEGQGSGLVNQSLREVALRMHLASKVLAASVGVTRASPPQLSNSLVLPGTGRVDRLAGTLITKERSPARARRFVSRNMPA